MIFLQRIKVCVRLARILVYLVLHKQLKLRDCFDIQKKGCGLSSTFIVGKRVVIKVRNERASANNRQLYNGKFDGLFFYDSDEERRQNEFRFYDFFHRHGMTAKPLLLTKDALVTSYIDSDEVHELSPRRLSLVFDLIDRIHALGVFHGDFNLSNFLFRGTDVFIVDFESTRHVPDDQRDDLCALDTIIFIEKLNRFHGELFPDAAPLVRVEIEKRKSGYNRVRDFGKKYLPEDVYAAVF